MDNGEMRILLCSVPDGSLVDTLLPPQTNEEGFYLIPNLAILRLMDWMEKYDYTADFYDINNLRPSDAEIIENLLIFNPTVVGLSAPLSHCYPNVKRITKILRDLFPDIWIVVGGHISASANVLMEKTETDLCVVGDGEIAWVKLLDYFKEHPSHLQHDLDAFSNILGLAYLDDNGDTIVTGYGEQLPQDELKFPDYAKLGAGLLDKKGWTQKYFIPANDHYVVKDTKYFNPDDPKNIGFIPTSKGCVAKCTFCQRYTKGYRVYDLENLESHIIDLKTQYNIGGIYVTDENFGSNRKQGHQFARLMKKHDLFWMAVGVRCTSVNYDDLEFYRDHNLIFIKFGIESGSQKILDVMEKKFDTADVFTAISNCAKLGIITEPDALMMGMPGETTETVIESAAFIASLRYELGLDARIGRPFWAMALPGTPLYEYSQQIGVIGRAVDEEEDYLIRTAEMKTNLFNYLNKTDQDIETVVFWDDLFQLEGKRAYKNLIIQNTAVGERLIEIYKKCVIPEWQALIAYWKVVGFVNLKGHIGALVEFVLNLSNIVLPKRMLYAIAKSWSCFKFATWSNTLGDEGEKPKYNLLVKNKLQVQGGRTALDGGPSDANVKRIDFSLRKIVEVKRQDDDPEKADIREGVDLLAKGQ